MSLVLGWSGGKDSALALCELRRGEVEPVALLTTVTDEFDRVSMHGVRQELVRRQAQAAAVPLVEVRVPPACTNEVYDARMAAALSSPPLEGCTEAAFGDVFLEDVRAYREERLAQAGLRAKFPLWGRDTRELAEKFIARGFSAIVCCVDPAKLAPAFAGRRYDAELLADLPAAVDPCGENGEFHTFVDAGPIFERPVGVTAGETVERDGFVFFDLLPA